MERILTNRDISHEIDNFRETYEKENYYEPDVLEVGRHMAKWSEDKVKEEIIKELENRISVLEDNKHINCESLPHYVIECLTIMRDTYRRVISFIKDGNSENFIIWPGLEYDMSNYNYDEE